jgi:hypothetical protein
MEYEISIFPDMVSKDSKAKENQPNLLKTAKYEIASRPTPYW